MKMWMCGPFLLLLWAFSSPCHCALYNYLAYCDVETIDVTVRIVNDVTEPRFDLSVPLRNVTRTTALGLLEEAADVDERFRFTVVLRRSAPGYLNAINGLRGPTPISDIPYWSLKTADNVIYTGGFENYLPVNNETIVFIYDDLWRYVGNESVTITTLLPKPESGCDVTERINVTLRLDVGFRQDDATMPGVARTNLLGVMLAPLNKTDPDHQSPWMVKMSFVNKAVGYVINDVDYIGEHYFNGSSTYWFSGMDPPARDLVWELRDSAGNPIPEGVTFYVPRNNDFVQLVYVPAPGDPTVGASTPVTTTQEE